MRSCGRALFREVARRWDAGEVKYDAAEAWQRKSISEEQLAAHSSFAKLAIEKQEVVEMACLLQKVHNKPNFRIGWALRLDFLVYLCNLAEGMGYGMALKALERVWGGAMEERSIRSSIYIKPDEPSSYMPRFLLQLQTDFEGGRSRSLDAPDIFSEFQNSKNVQNDVNMSYRILYTGLDLLCPELLGAFWLVSFLLDVGIHVLDDRDGGSFTYKNLLVDIFQASG